MMLKKDTRRAFSQVRGPQEICANGAPSSHSLSLICSGDKLAKPIVSEPAGSLSDGADAKLPARDVEAPASASLGICVAVLKPWLAQRGRVTGQANAKEFHVHS